MVECSRTRKSHGGVQYSQVDPRRDIEVFRIHQRQVEQW